MTGRAERRAFLERSLADLDEEHAAGDLSDDDHARLRADYERRLAALDGSRPQPSPARPARRSAGARLAIGTGVLVFAVGAGVLLAQSLGRRSATGNITGADVAADGGSAGTDGTDPAADLPEALTRCFDLPSADALTCYIAYTRANPSDPQGFLYFGLFSVRQGMQSGNEELFGGGETFLRRALDLDPTLVEARVNLAVLLERTGRDDEARAELDQLAGTELPADLQSLVAFVERNLAG
jgi:cytochrome c-type biogenesis protein CcmH/NrfG